MDQGGVLMRSTLRIAALIFVLLTMLLPLAAYASCGGPCPDDPVLSQTCDSTTPDFYVVANRTFDRLGPQYGTGCQPWILENPDCIGWTVTPTECADAAKDVETRICGGELPSSANPATDKLYEMYCDDGHWVYRERPFTAIPGGFECDPAQAGPWMDYLPPHTGIDLPAPLIVGGLAIAGVALVGTGFAVRRRTAKLA
jgi:hypothetical protein